MNKALAAKSNKKTIVFVLALATGLYSAHVFVPPTPGPLAAASILGADLGMVLLLGLVVALPVSVAGYLWGRFISAKLPAEETKEVAKSPQQEEISVTGLPSVFKVILPIIVPIVLIALKSVAEYPTKPLGEALLFKVLLFLGNPIVALLIGVFFAFLLGAKVKTKDKGGWVSTALQQAGTIILVTGAGGAFGEVIRSFDFAEALSLSSESAIGGLFICFGVAALLKTAQGSSTVAIITTAAIVAPLLSVFGLQSITEVALTVLAIGAGAMTVSHVNDSYFWVVSQFSNLSLNTALKGHTLATLVQGLTAMLIIIVLYFFIQ